MEIHFECPYCAKRMKGDESLRGEIIQCPDCEKSFSPTILGSKTAGPVPDRASGIRRTAQFFVFLGAVFAVFGVVWLLPSAGGVSPGGFEISAASIGAGLWLYFIGQVIHIRANTEK